MKWEDRGRSRNLEDRRGRGGVGRGVGRAGGAIPLGIGGLILVFAISAITGVDIMSLLGLGTAPTSAPPSQQELQAEEEQVRFVSFVLDDVQGYWQQTF